MAEPFPPHSTIGQIYGPAMEITDQAEADAYFERCVEYCMREGRSRTEAEDIERYNLGYYAGYYSTETRARFGPVADGVPTTEEIMKMGYDMGRKARDANR